MQEHRVVKGIETPDMAKKPERKKKTSKYLVEKDDVKNNSQWLAVKCKGNIGSCSKTSFTMILQLLPNVHITVMCINNDSICSNHSCHLMYAGQSVVTQGRNYRRKGKKGTIWLTRQPHQGCNKSSSLMRKNSMHIFTDNAEHRAQEFNDDEKISAA